MATVTQTRERKTGGSGFGCILLIVIVGAVLFGFLSMMGTSLGTITTNSAPLPALNDHAVNKHGAAAVTAWEHINRSAKSDFCKWKCPDGRTRYLCWIRSLNEWAFAAINEDGSLATSFLTTQRYARKIIDEAGCKNPWHYSHP